MDSNAKKLVQAEMERQLKSLRAAGTTLAQLEFIKFLCNKTVEKIDDDLIQTEKDAADFVLGVLAGATSALNQIDSKK